MFFLNSKVKALHDITEAKVSQLFQSNYFFFFCTELLMSVLFHWLSHAGLVFCVIFVFLQFVVIMYLYICLIEVASLLLKDTFNKLGLFQL